MNKLEELHICIAQEEYNNSFDEGGHTNFLDTKKIGKKSAEISTNVAIKFAEWCNKPSLEDLRQPNVVYIPSDNFYWYKHNKYTPKELFELFINNYYEKNT